MQADYSMLMPFIVSALPNRKRYQQLAATLSAEELAKQRPHAGGYLRPKEGYRLFGQREELCRRLTADVANNREWLLESLKYPVAV
jgi:deoxyhypusine synthase